MKSVFFKVQIKISGTLFKPYKPLFENNPYDDELNSINYQYRNEYSFLQLGTDVQLNGMIIKLLLN